MCVTRGLSVGWLAVGWRIGVEAGRGLVGDVRRVDSDLREP